jgi:hypothetical protein
MHLLKQRRNEHHTFDVNDVFVLTAFEPKTRIVKGISKGSWYAGIVK